ncbi:MAG: PH domain-containing protein [Patescibacteria group bacterium]|nr:PH domain-containing protein [Patescibacteria group bacterium]
MITLLKDEEIILIKRRHSFIFISETMGLILISIIPFLLIGFINLIPENIIKINNILQNYFNYYLFFSFCFIFICWLIFIISWTNYYLDTIIITNKRIIDIEQINLFHRDEAEIRYENIEDIKVETIGFLASILKFGNIHIQSAAEAREIIIKNISNPYEVKDIISKQKEIASQK